MTMETVRRFCIQVGGGLGDQVCAEPVFRYMIKHWCRNDDIALMTQYPSLFRHLPVTAYDQNRNFPEQRLYIGTHPDKGHDPYIRTLGFQRCHPVDYIAIRLLRRTLPLADRTIQLQVDPTALDKMKQRLKDALPKTVLIHPGTGWESKTFSPEFWDSYIEILKQNGYFVVLIGVNNRAQATLSGDWDSRDQLSIDELIALISIAPVLISNDSGPVHLAGAFDNWIGLIASCKDPSYILPYRNGSMTYKTKSLEKYKAYNNELNFDPLVIEDMPISFLTEDVKNKIMPSAEEILDFVKSALP